MENAYLIDVYDTTYGNRYLLHTEVELGYSKAEDRWNRLCVDTFNGMFGDSKNMHVEMRAMGYDEAVLAMDRADYEFYL